MRLRHLKTFKTVAATLNVTRAAERLHLAQSSVTEQIQTLEADLGAALFDRAGRRLALTAAGRRLVAYADEILDLADEARAAVAGSDAAVEGPLAIGALETLGARGLPALLARFQALHPAVTPRLTIAGTGALRRAVAEGELDAALTFGPNPDARLRDAVAWREPMSVIAPPNHRLADGRAVTSEALAGESFLVTEAGCAYRAMFEAAFPAGDRPRIAGEYGSLGAIRSLVAAGVGLAFVPRLVAEGDGPPIAFLPWADAREVEVLVSWRRRRRIPPALRAFLDAVSDQPMTAVDVQGRPGDEAVVHGEEDRLGDVLG